MADGDFSHTLDNWEDRRAADRFKGKMTEQWYMSENRVHVQVVPEHIEKNITGQQV